MSETRSFLRSWLLLSLLSFAVVAAGCAEAGGGDDDDDDTAQIDASPSVTPDASTSGGCSSCDTTTSNGCQEDRCVCNLGPACSAGSTCCSLGCRNLDSDPNNCGQCGKACGVGESCQAGQCICAASGGECPAGQSCCSTGCTDTNTDEANCGSCGAPCDENLTCNGGMCGCGFECPLEIPLFTKIVCCGDGCYDVCSDANHCNGCEPTDCPGGCEFGACLDADGGSDGATCLELPI